MAKRLRVPISTARTKLFQLTDLVRKSGDDTVVVLEQRGSAEPVALVREARLAYLEDRVMRLDRQRGAPFTLSASLTTHLDDAALEQALRGLRQAWVSQPNSPVPTPVAKRRRGR